MTLSPEACSPQNVERLLAQIARTEEALAVEKAARVTDINHIEAAVGLATNQHPMQRRTFEELLAVLAAMNAACRLDPPTEAMQLDRERTMRLSYEKASETWRARSIAYSTFIDDVMALARQRDLELVWIKGAQLKALYDKMLQNPNA